MLLSDNCIKAAIAAGTFGIEPYSPEMIQPASIDVRLDDKFIGFEATYGLGDSGLIRDPTVDNRRFLETPVLTSDEIHLHPGEFLLGSTLEKVKIPSDISARFEGKSCLGRIGLLTH